MADPLSVAASVVGLVSSWEKMIIGARSSIPGMKSSGGVFREFAILLETIISKIEDITKLLKSWPWASLNEDLILELLDFSQIFQSFVSSTQYEHDKRQERLSNLFPGRDNQVNKLRRMGKALADKARRLLEWLEIEKQQHLGRGIGGPTISKSLQDQQRLGLSLADALIRSSSLVLPSFNSQGLDTKTFQSSKPSAPDEYSSSLIQQPRRRRRRRLLKDGNSVIELSDDEYDDFQEKRLSFYHSDREAVRHKDGGESSSSKGPPLVLSDPVVDSLLYKAEPEGSFEGDTPKASRSEQEDALRKAWTTRNNLRAEYGSATPAADNTTSEDDLTGMLGSDTDSEKESPAITPPGISQPLLMPGSGFADDFHLKGSGEMGEVERSGGSYSSRLRRARKGKRPEVPGPSWPTDSHHRSRQTEIEEDLLLDLTQTCLAMAIFATLYVVGKPLSMLQEGKSKIQRHCKEFYKLKPGTALLRWQCVCGHESYDYLEDTSIENARLLARDLEDADAVKYATVGQNYLGGFAKLFILLRNGTRAVGRMVDKVFKRASPGNLATLDAPAELEFLLPQGDPLWLLLCVNGSDLAVLKHVDVRNTASDKALFQHMREAYIELRSTVALIRRWLTQLGQIHVAKFQLFPRTYVDGFVMPKFPENQDEYSFTTCKQLPAKYMLHLYKRPEDGAGHKFFLDRFPKKKNSRLEWCSEKEVEGYGVYFTERVHTAMVVTTFFILSSVAGILFGVLYTVLGKKDPGASFTVAAFITSVGALGMASWAAWAVHV